MEVLNKLGNTYKSVRTLQEQRTRLIESFYYSDIDKREKVRLLKRVQRAYKNIAMLINKQRGIKKLANGKYSDFLLNDYDGMIYGDRLYYTSINN